MFVHKLVCLQTQYLPVNVSPAGFIVPFSQGMSSVGDGSFKSRRLTQNVSTQTVGLFYPSQKQLDINKDQEEEKLALEKQMRDRRPLLTAVSPGRGEYVFSLVFWGPASIVVRALI